MRVYTCVYVCVYASVCGAPQCVSGACGGPEVDNLCLPQLLLTLHDEAKPVSDSPGLGLQLGLTGLEFTRVLTPTPLKFSKQVLCPLSHPPSITHYCFVSGFFALRQGLCVAQSGLGPSAFLPQPGLYRRVTTCLSLSVPPAPGTHSVWAWG